MPTTTRDLNWLQFARTMLLGLVLAVGIAVVGGQADMAWLGFALAAMYAETLRSGRCRRLTKRSAG